MKPAAVSRIPVRRRILLASLLLTTFGMVALIVLVAIVLNTVVGANVDEVLNDRVTAASSTLQREGPTVRVRETEDPIESFIWFFDSTGRLLEGARTPRALRGPLTDLARSSERTWTEQDGWRLLATPVTLQGEQEPAAVVVAGVPLAPYRTTTTVALLVSAGLGVLVVIGVGLMTAWTVWRALQPVAGMAQRASEWSEKDLNKRFDLGEPHDEITQLGKVLDVLLERVARAIRAEQRLTSEVAHELRTPLTVIRAEADLALTDPQVPADERVRFHRIITSADSMASAVDTLLALARGDVGQDRVPVDRVLRAAAAAVDGTNGRLTVNPARDLSIAVPENVALRALLPLVENALRYAAENVTLTATATASQVQIAVIDDGAHANIQPSVDVFEPGIRDPASPSTGLGLSVARRTARAAGGDVTLHGLSPTTFVLALPRARIQ
jgi:two-component system OmpR family sensor kinase